jgi:hypothetical protein
MTILTPFLKDKCARLTDKFIKWELMLEFRNKVDIQGLPSYTTVVKQPMWLAEVKKRLREGAYRTLEAYESEMNLIWSNAMLFNAREDLLFRYAEIGQERFSQKMNKMQKTPEEEYLYKLTKLAARVAALSAAFHREIDHTSTAALKA